MFLQRAGGWCEPAEHLKEAVPELWLRTILESSIQRKVPRYRNSNWY